MTESNLRKYGPAQRDGTAFVMPKAQADKLLADAGGDAAKFEEALGLPSGTLQTNPMVRVDIPHPRDLNVRMPRGTEAGANSQWLPGGYLPNGQIEAVVDLGVAKPGAYTTTPVVTGAPAVKTISPGEALRAKYSYMTADQRALRLDELAESNAYRRLQEIESSTPGAHFLEKHGAQTTLQSQLERAQYGANPTTGIVETYANGKPKIPSSATRFLSNRDQLNAIDRAQNIYRLTGDVTLAERPINFNYLIGEGYKKTSLAYGQSYSAQVWFRQGKVNTAFPIWGQ
jgi:hypothetical protein